MPFEERHIEFSDVETAAALQRFVRKRQPGRQTVALRHVRALGDGEMLTGVQATGNQGMEPVKLDLTLAEVTAALLGWCFSKEIPIPRQANKRIVFARQRFSLVLEIDVATNAGQEKTPDQA
jgi:hypothetical protein